MTKAIHGKNARPTKKAGAAKGKQAAVAAALAASQQGAAPSGYGAQYGGVNTPNMGGLADLIQR